VTLDGLGWDPELAAAAEAAKNKYGDVEFGRVAADFGLELRVVGPFGDERAALAGRLRFTEGARPAVGDFVALIGAPGSRVVVEILPRRSWLARQAAGKRTDLQLIGANLDYVFIVTSFNEDFNVNRIERYVVAVRQGGAQPVVIINKADLVDEQERKAILEELRERLGDETPVMATSALSDEGLEPIRGLLQPGVTASFVGSSGVGKSSIVNQLLGEERQAVRDVREYDDRGRHTTTHRELFLLDDGSLVIDTPGMREFQLWDEVVDEAFDDIAELALECRFRDCMHETEPGCAVREAVEEGELDRDRLESWRKLQREAEYQRRRQDEAARREKGREFAKVVRDAKRLKRERKKTD
jgi:ribosome biogenesis GTPase